jgi:hypothetical protein
MNFRALSLYMCCVQLPIHVYICRGTAGTWTAIPCRHIKLLERLLQTWTRVYVCSCVSGCIIDLSLESLSKTRHIYRRLHM